MGKSGQGKVQLKPTNRIKPTGWGASAHGAMQGGGGGGAPCLYCKEDIVAGIIIHGTKLPQPENKCPLPDRAPAQG